MGRRVIGGLVGWLIGVLPLVGVNLANYFGFYPGDPVVVGMLALFGGLIVGAVISGLIGGRARDNGMSGAAGASVSGGIAALFYAVSIIAFIFLARSSDALPAIAAAHPIRISAVILFFAAVFLGIAMLTGQLLGRHNPETLDAVAPPMSRQYPENPQNAQYPQYPMQRRPSAPVGANSMRQGQGHGHGQGQQPYRQDVSARYNNPQVSSTPMASPMRRGDGGSQPNRRADQEPYNQRGEDW
jgi:hypothetical protein